MVIRNGESPLICALILCHGDDSSLSRISEDLKRHLVCITENNKPKPKPI